uniref:Uncharacterized protein n=1 Tax=Panagrolaimus sp. ES5 TaxID=591445 RepID=A0AC34GVM2_9BILA
MRNSRISGSQNDDIDEEYESDHSIPVYHPLFEYVEISDEDEVEPESEESPEMPGPSRPQKRCVNICVEESSKKICKPSSDRSFICNAQSSYKHVLDQYYRNELMLVLPQFHYPINAPSKMAYKRWQELPFDNKLLPKHVQTCFEEALEKFRCFRNGRTSSNATTLIIGDSILSSCNFEEKLDSTVQIMVTFPNKVIDFVNAFINKVQDGNDFYFRNVVIALGIEFICYDPDEKEAVNASREFIMKLLRAFHNNLMTARFIILTVPQVNDDRNTCSYSYHIDYYNKNMRKFVSKYGEEIKEKWDIEFLLFDWEKNTGRFRESTIEDVSKRYQVLINEIAKFTSSNDEKIKDANYELI